MMLTRRLIVVTSICAAVVISSASAAAQLSFTDDPLIAGVTPIRAIHITELRARIDSLREIVGLTPYAWTDPILSPGVTQARAVHVQELRTALAAAGSNLGRPVTSYSEPIVVGRSIKVSDISELRAVVEAWESYVESGGGPGSGGGSNPPGSGECATASLSPAYSGFAMNGGTRTSAVAANVNCQWSATSDSLWITVSTSSGAGNGSIDYAVALNDTGLERTGTVIVADQEVVIYQAATADFTPCLVSNASDASNEIDDCLRQGNIVELPPGQYVIKRTLHFTKDGTVFRGPERQPPHGIHPERVRPGATIVADATLSGRILEAVLVNELVLQDLDFNGNRGQRTTPGVDCGGQGNLMIQNGNGLRMTRVSSHDAKCGSGAEVSGSDITVESSHFYNNGYPTHRRGLSGPDEKTWSDGLTIWRCNGISRIEDNQFEDNTDVDLIIGGGTGSCVVQRNHIVHNTQYGFAGIMAAFFEGNAPEGHPEVSDHRGVHYFNNQVIAAPDTLSFGIMLGNHPWFGAFSSTGEFVETEVLLSDVTGNQSDGAFIGLAIDGVKEGQVTGNTMANHDAANGGLSCPPAGSADYTAGHYSGTTSFGPTTVQDLQTAVALVWDYSDPQALRVCHAPQE